MRVLGDRGEKETQREILVESKKRERERERERERKKKRERERKNMYALV